MKTYFKKLTTLFVTAFAALSLTAVSSAQALEYFQQELDPNFVQDVLNIFPERQVIPDNLINFEGDPNIHLYQEAEVFVSFIDEGAGYQNSFGYFTYEDANDDGEITHDEILSETIVFANVSKQGGGGEMQTGDSVNLGKFPEGTNIGFFIIANGNKNANGSKYYTIDTLNRHHERHLALVAMNDYDAIVLGIEDLPLSKSDLDFNDVTFFFYTNPIEAIREIIEEGNIATECDLIDEDDVREECQVELEETWEERAEPEEETEVAPEEIEEEPEAPRAVVEAQDEVVIVEPVNDIQISAVAEEFVDIATQETQDDTFLIQGSGTFGCDLNAGGQPQGDWVWMVLVAGLLTASRQFQRAV